MVEEEQRKYSLEKYLKGENEHSVHELQTEVASLEEQLAAAQAKLLLEKELAEDAELMAIAPWKCKKKRAAIMMMKETSQ